MTDGNIGWVAPQANQFSWLLAARSPVRVTLPVNTEYQQLDKLKCCIFFNKKTVE